MQNGKVDSVQIGIAGFGKMGSAMAARLVDTGAEVMVWNREPGRPRAAGFEVAATPRELAARCPIVLTSLLDAKAVASVYGGPHGLIAGGAGKLFIEMSTVEAHTQVALATEVVGAGAAFLECPVSGTTAPARAGQLVGLLGGERADVERALPVLSKLCRRLAHMGPVGAGAVAKLAINLPLLAFWQSFGEAMALMKRIGKEPDQLVDLFADTAGAPAVLKVKARSIAATLAGQDDAVAPTYDIHCMRKDLRLILAEADNSRVELPVGQTLLGTIEEAVSAGWGERDCAWVPAYWAAKAGH